MVSFGISQAVEKLESRRTPVRLVLPGVLFSGCLETVDAEL